MNHKVIGVTGPAGSGKDTVADFICEGLVNFRKLSFATPMKTMLECGLGLTHAQLHGDLKEIIDERYGCTPRHMMQTIGTEWGRDRIHPDIWVSAVEGIINETNKNIVLADVRFENEAVLVRKYGVLIHITGRNALDSDHASEEGVGMIAADLVIHNLGSLEGLQQTAREVLRHIQSLK